MAPVVLVADDDPDDVLLLSRAFLTAGLPHRIVHVRNSLEAIRYLAGEQNYVDRFKYPLPRLLVLDLNTSREHGLTLLEWLEKQSNLRSLPVVVISASDNTADRQKAAMLGVDAYRVKPAGLPGWVAIVKDLAARWLSPNPEPRRGKQPPKETAIQDRESEHAGSGTETIGFQRVLVLNSVEAWLRQKTADLTAVSADLWPG